MERKMLYVLVAVVIIAVAALLIIFTVLSSNKSDISIYDNQPVPQAVLASLNVPQNVSSAVGVGSASTSPYPKRVNGTFMSVDGKPEILYVGAEYCPYCAAERWAMIIALMRFGTFSNLHLMTSSPSDYAPNTATFTFYNSTYTSPYISFTSVELTSNKPVNGAYPTLQQMNASESSAAGAFDLGGSTPFIDYANVSVQVGSNYDPESVLAGMNWTQISTALSNPSTAQSQAIVGSANLMTAQICRVTNNTPSSVCSQQYAQQIEKKFG